MSWLKENWFKLSLVLIASGVGITIGYYLVIYIPVRDKSDRTVQELKEITGNKVENIRPLPQTQNNKTSDPVKLNLCLLDAEDAYAANWSLSCVLEGKKENCISLTPSQVRSLEKNLELAKGECFKKFK